MSNKGPTAPSFYNSSLPIRQEIQRFESVHPNIYAIYDLLELIPDPLLSQQIREHVVCIEDSFVNSQEWTLSSTAPDLRLGVVGHLTSGKSALVHRYLTGSYMQDESPEGGRFKKEVIIDGQSYLLLIRDEGSLPELQFTNWVDGVILVFSLDSEVSFRAVSTIYNKMCHYRQDLPLVLVGTQDAISASNPRVIEDVRARHLAGQLVQGCYYETCATYGLNVDRVFQDACQKIVNSKMAMQAASLKELSNGASDMSSKDTFVDFVTPSSTPNTSRKNRRKSNLFPPLKRFNNNDALKNGSEVGSGRAIPLRQGYLYKRSWKALNKEWKKKYVALLNDGRLTYHPNLHDYMDDVHGKEIPLMHTTVKVPGQKPRGTEITGESHLLPATNPSLLPLVKKRHRRMKSLGVRGDQDEAEDFEFVIVSLDNKQWTFEASSLEDRDGWVTAIELQILTSLQSNESSKDKSKMSTLIELNSLRTSIAGNQNCLDCDSPSPDWASLNIGALICIECSGIHRNLGSHISRVRSLDLDIWLPEQLSVMTALGNTAANIIWEGDTKEKTKPTPSSSREEKERWIKAKFEYKEFLAPLRNTAPLQQQVLDAICRGDVSLVALILAHDPGGGNLASTPISARDLKTPLHVAAAMAHMPICQLLLWNGAKVEALDCDGRTPLMYSQATGFKDLIDFFTRNSSQSA